MRHVMVDLETLSLRPRAWLLEVAAVPFDEEAVHVDRAFHAYVAGGQDRRHVDRATLLWWLSDDVEQGAGHAARERLMRGLRSDQAVPLGSALHTLRDWLAAQDSPLVWAHGAAFDLGVLRDAYHEAGHNGPPWSHRDERDARTALEMSYLGRSTDHWIYEHDAEKLLGGDRFVKHCALHDAVAQALRVQRVLR